MKHQLPSYSDRSEATTASTLEKHDSISIMLALIPSTSLPSRHCAHCPWAQANLPLSPWQESSYSAQHQRGIRRRCSRRFACSKPVKTELTLKSCNPALAWEVGLEGLTRVASRGSSLELQLQTRQTALLQSRSAGKRHNRCLSLRCSSESY